MKILYLVGPDNQISLLKTRLISGAVNHVVICPVEYGCQEHIVSLSRYLQEQQIPFDVFNFLDTFNRKAFDLKDEFLKFIFEISESKLSDGQSLKEHLKVVHGDVSLWWASLIAEKSPYRSRIFSDFIRLFSVLEAKTQTLSEQIWVDPLLGEIAWILAKTLKDDGVVLLRPFSLVSRWAHGAVSIFIVEQLRAMRFFLGISARILFLKIYNRSSRLRFEKVRESDSLCVTMFPFVDRKALADGHFVNRAYGALQTAFIKSNRRSLTWLGMSTRIEDLRWRHAIAIAKQVNQSGNNFIFYEEFIGAGGIIKIAYCYVRHLFRTLFCFKRYSPCFRKSFRGTEGLSFFEIFQKDFISSFAGKELMVQLSFYISFSHCVEKYFQKGQVIYFAEMQGWENILNACCRKSEDITVMGLQHTIVPKLLLTYFHDPRAFLGDDAVSCVPRPHQLGCAGDIPRALLLEGGWPAGELSMVGAFRFQGLLKDRFNKTAFSGNAVLVALSISNTENDEVLRMVHDAFHDLKGGVRVMIKEHPCYALGPALRRLGIALDPDIFEVTKKSLDEALDDACAMIVKESSSAFYALTKGRPVIIPQLYGIVDLCPLTKVSTLAIYVENSQELREAVKRSCDYPQGIIAKSAVEDFLKKYFTIYEDECCYLENIEKALKGDRRFQIAQEGCALGS